MAGESLPMILLSPDPRLCAAIADGTYLKITRQERGIIKSEFHLVSLSQLIQYCLGMGYPRQRVRNVGMTPNWKWPSVNKLLTRRLKLAQRRMGHD